MNKLLPSSVNSTESHPLVLVVDDEPRIIRFVRINLEMEGFRVIEASDGLEALQKLSAQIYDTLLLDLRMPRKEGMDVLRTVRKNSPSLPVIVVSGLPRDEDLARAG